ncbi:hypothetical protein WDU94_011510 [Cyamophila willieti]
MKFAFKFSNLLGTVYRKGDLVFTKDGNSVISPVGNKITIYDLKNNKSKTLCIESSFNFEHLALSPNNSTLVAINEKGDASLVSMISQTVIHTHRFNRPVNFVTFTPDGLHLIVAKENTVFVFKAPGLYNGEYVQFHLARVYENTAEEAVHLTISDDSNIIAVGYRDGSVRLHGIKKFKNFFIYSFSSHSDSIKCLAFEVKSLDLISVSRDGTLCIWESNIEPSDLVPFTNQPPPQKKKKKKSKSFGGDQEESEDEVDLTSGEMRDEMVEPESNEAPDIPEDSSYEKLNYKRLGRHFLSDLNSDKHARVSCASYHQTGKVLVVGFSNGSFYLLEMPDVNLIHSLSISESEITAVSFNVTGDWLALGCSDRGQLLVWEWQSETYVLKQQGHSNAVSSVAYSHDGQFIASGGEDGKVKLWNVHTGFCFVTFSEHDSPVSAVHFSNTRKFVLSASVDGTVRAFDLTRYRNFRTFTTPRPVQLNCLALDSTSEFVAAGGQDVFEIYIWSMKLGRLLEVLSGHEGPVSCIEFSPVLSSTGMVSVSWDKTIKLWNAVETSTQHETIHLTSDALCVAYKPDGTEIVVSTLDGQLLMFNVESAAQVGSIEARRDLDTGRLDTDLVTREQTLKAKAVSTLCYSADGSCILAAGQSKHICIYSSREGILLKKFTVTQNKSLDGINDFINRRKMTEFGNIALVETRESREGGNVHLKLPGVRSGDMAARVLKPEVRVLCVKFSPTGQAWVAATSEGVHIYSLDPGHVFDPFLLDISITPQSVKEALAEQDYAKALMMSLKLNEQGLIIHVLESVRTRDIALTVRSLAEVYQEKLLKVIAAMLEVSKHIEFYVTWAVELLSQLRSPSQTTLVHLQRNLNKKYGDLAKICDFNIYTLQLISRLGPLRIKPKVEKMETNSSDEEQDSEDEEDAEIRVLEEQEV